MTPDEDVLAALKALAEHDRDLQAPAAMEKRLRRAFRRSRTMRRLSILATAAAVVAMIGLGARAVRRHEPPRTVDATPQFRQPRVAAAKSIASPAKPKVTRVERAPEREVVTDFFPLVDFDAPVGHGELVRVSLPAEAMRSVGLPVREDRLFERVQADVVVNEEGMATAIRFVEFSGGK